MRIKKDSRKKFLKNIQNISILSDKATKEQKNGKKRLEK